MGADGVNISPSDTVKPAPGVDEPCSTVARYAGAQARDLLLHPGVMLYAARDVRPGAVLLEYRQVLGYNFC